MAARKKRKTATKRNPPNKRVSSSKASSKRKAHAKRAKRTAKGRATDTRRIARKPRATSKSRAKPTSSRQRIRKTVERATRPKLKRNKQGGLREYQGKRFRETKFGDYKAALKSVGEENQHAYDEAVEALREGLEEGLSKAAITRRRNKVRRLKK